jgi:hypothetical protein
VILTLAASAAIAGAILSPVPTNEPAEDSPAWDCRIHGDHICGVPTGNGYNALVEFDEHGMPVMVVGYVSTSNV